MNGADARAEWEDDRGWTGVFKLDWRTEEFKVRKPGTEETEYFKTPLEAEVAAWRAKHKIERPVMTRDGEVMDAVAKADAKFNLKPFKLQDRKAVK